MKNIKIVALPICCIDHYSDQNKMHPGGNSLNFLVNCRKLNPTAHLSLVSKIRNDEYLEKIQTNLETYKLDTLYVKTASGNSASNKIYNTKNGERYSHHCDWQNGVLESVISIWGD